VEAIRKRLQPTICRRSGGLGSRTHPGMLHDAGSDGRCRGLPEGSVPIEARAHRRVITTIAPRSILRRWRLPGDQIWWRRGLERVRLKHDPHPASALARGRRHRQAHGCHLAVVGRHTKMVLASQPSRFGLMQGGRNMGRDGAARIAKMFAERRDDAGHPSGLRRRSWSRQGMDPLLGLSSLISFDCVTGNLACCGTDVRRHVAAGTHSSRS